MSVALCRHIKTNGTRCQSPALTGELWCYFHHRLHQRHAGFRRNSSNVDYRLPGPHIELAPLEDRESIQLASRWSSTPWPPDSLRSPAPPPCSTASRSPPATPPAASSNPLPQTSSAR